MTSQQEADILLAEHQAKRQAAINAFYEAERNGGVPCLLANERMHFFAARLDAAYECDLEIIKQCIGRRT